MSNPLIPPAVTIPQDVQEKARQDRQHVTTTGLLFNTGLVAAYAALGAKITPARTHAVETITSLNVKPAPGGFKVRPKPLAILYLAPAPLGVVPPEYYGLKPNYLEKALPQFLQFETLGTKASAARIEEYKARQANRLLAEPPHRNFRFGPTSFRDLEENLALLAPYEKTIPGAAERLAIGRAEMQRLSIGIAGSALQTPNYTPARVPQQIANNPLPAIQPVVSVGGGGDYGGGGGDPLDQAEHGDRTIRTAVGQSDPLPAAPRPRPNKPSEPSSALQQEAARRAPPVLRELVGERADP